MLDEKVTIGDATLYHGDCRAIWAHIQGVDAVISDPPYGISHESHGQRFKEATPIEGDECVTLAEDIRLWAQEREVAACLFFSPYRPLQGFRNVLVWNKGAHVGIGGDRATCWKRDFELIGVEGNGALAGQRDSAVLFEPALLPPPSGHFAEKPVKLIERLITKLACKSVFDPCMGSGTTGVAAANLGRQFVGIEIERRWFDLACERIEKTYAQGRLFA